MFDSFHQEDFLHSTVQRLFVIGIEGDRPDENYIVIGFLVLETADIKSGGARGREPNGQTLQGNKVILGRLRATKSFEIFKRVFRHTEQARFRYHFWALFSFWAVRKGAGHLCRVS